VEESKAKVEPGCRKPIADALEGTDGVETIVRAVDLIRLAEMVGSTRGRRSRPCRSVDAVRSADPATTRGPSLGLEGDTRPRRFMVIFLSAVAAIVSAIATVTAQIPAYATYFRERRDRRSSRRYRGRHRRDDG
jgi:hypothetical protein